MSRSSVTIGRGRLALLLATLAPLQCREPDPFDWSTPAPPPPPPEDDPVNDMPWIPVALGEYGVAEIRGGETPRIMEYHRVSGTKQDEDEDAWCGAFAGWVMAQVGLPIVAGAAAARSWLRCGQQLQEPRFGCLTVLWRVSPTSWQGHVGFLVRATADHVWLLGGNQNDSVNVQRFPRSQVLGFRWPVPA